MPCLPSGQPDPADYEFLHLFFREVSQTEIVPGRAAYLPLTRRLERGRVLACLEGQNPFEIYTQLNDAYQRSCEKIDKLTAAHRIPPINQSALSNQIEDFLDQPEVGFPAALAGWVQMLPKAVQNEGELAVWELLWLTALIPPEQRTNLPQTTFSTAYVFHFDDIRQQAADSLRRLTEGTLRYVVIIARLYVGRGIPFLDLVHAGYTGLVRAANLYTERGGAHFQHYASNWIRQRIDRYITDTVNLVRVPTHAYRDMQSVRWFVQQMRGYKGIDPTDEEVAFGLGWVNSNDLYEQISVDTAPEDQVEDVTANELDDEESESRPIGIPIVLQHTRSARKAVEKVRQFRRISDIASLERSKGVLRLADSQFSLISVVNSRLLRDALTQALGRLNPRASEIIALRYGLADGETRTLEEVGRLMGVTRERVRQIEAGALDKLRSFPLLNSLARPDTLADERGTRLPNRLVRPRRALYTPPRLERQWVDGLIAQYIERGQRGNPLLRLRQRARARVYAEVLREAGKPLPYRDIHARAVERFPDLAELPLRTIYSTLFYHALFRLTKGQGVFGLAEWETGDAAEMPIGRPLSPLLPPNASPNRLLDSVMYGLDQLTRRTGMTARDFLAAQVAYLRVDSPTDAIAQDGFDVWVALGLIEPVRYPQDADTPLRLKTTRRIGEPMPSILSDFLANFAGSILKIPELLSALDRLDRADVNTLNQWVFGGKAIDLAGHLKILAGLNAVSWDGTVWGITTLGREVLGRLEVSELPEPPSPDDEPDDDDLEDELGLLDEI